MTRLPPSSAPRRFFYAAGGGRGSRRWIAACLVFFPLSFFSRWEWKISFVSFLRSWEILFWFSPQRIRVFLAYVIKKNWGSYIVVNEKSIR